MTTTSTIQTANRIHPLMAGAAISVTLLSLVGAAAIAGLLPNSRGAIAPAESSLVANAALPAPAAPLVAPLVAQTIPQNVQQLQPQQQQQAPAPARVVHKPRVHHTQVAQASHSYEERRYDRQYQHQPAPQVAQTSQSYDERRYDRQYQPAAQAAPAQTNYVGIGTGAVIGGLLGNQVGGGRGKTLATIAGVIGGGMLGNEAQKQIQQAPQR